MTEPLTPLDATFLELEEADEAAHMHIGGVLVFEAAPEREPAADRDRRRQLESRLASLPRYRMRLSKPDGRDVAAAVGARPRVRHRRARDRGALPGPGGEQELLDWAADFWSLRLDRSRPLWEVVLVEGLQGGRWAMCTKTHHALVDGVGSVDAAHLLLDTARRPRRRAAQTALAEPDHPHRGLFGRAASTLTSGVKAGADVAVHPQRLLQVLGQAEGMIELILKDEVKAAPGSSSTSR